jgi:hypothetical protein
MKILLTAEEVDAIRAQRKEGGGYQALFRTLEAGLEGNELTTDRETAERTIRYANDYGQGGWQDALRAIARKLAAAME